MDVGAYGRVCVGVCACVLKPSNKFRGLHLSIYTSPSRILMLCIHVCGAIHEITIGCE